jgi:hypothetical protein
MVGRIDAALTTTDGRTSMDPIDAMLVAIIITALAAETGPREADHGALQSRTVRDLFLSLGNVGSRPSDRVR